MADFRKMFYALAIVALIACFTVPASAQSFACLDLHATNETIRVEGWSELVGDIVLGCTGGVHTTPGAFVQQATITVTFPQTQISSKIVDVANSVSEAVLIVDDIRDQTSSTAQAGSRPHYVCSNDSGPSGTAVCDTIAPTNAQDTYDGATSNTNGAGGCAGGTTSAGTPAPATGSSYGCGRPNIFQGRPVGNNVIQFPFVPLDPPGTGFTRTLRITNIRVNGTVFDPTNPFAQVVAIVQFQGNASIGLNNIQTTVATVSKGLGTTSIVSDKTFLQCDYPLPTDQSPKETVGLDLNHGYTTCTIGAGGCVGSGFTAFGTSAAETGPIAFPNFTTTGTQMRIRISEGFQSAFKAKNMAEIIGAGCVGGSQVCSVLPFLGLGVVSPGLGANDTGNGNSPYAYNNAGIVNAAYGTGTYWYGITGPANYPSDIDQNSPAARWFTESGFVDTEAIGSTTHGFKTAGVADYGTRIQFTVGNQPNGAIVALPTQALLFNSTSGSAKPTGIAVMTNVTGTGKGAYSPVSPLSGLPSVQNAGYFDLTGPSQTVTYEIVFDDPGSTEFILINPLVYYPAKSLPTSVNNDLAQPNVTATVSGVTFAPWYAAGGDQSNNGQLNGTPRFIQSNGTLSPSGDLFTIVRCNCSLLFPWVVSDANYVTGIAVANTSKDPTNGLTPPVVGFTAGQESGKVNLYLFGTVAGVTATANSNALNPTIVPAATYPGTDTVAKSGSYATFIVNTGFTGYAITQANFQYCHGLAFLFNGNGAVPPVSYLGLVMDVGGLSRTIQPLGDTLGH